MKRLICLGDSLTDSERLFSPNGLGYGYVNRLNQLLTDAGKSVTIINRGVNGFTVARLAAMGPFIFLYPREYANWIPFVRHISGQIGDLAAE